MGRVLPTVILGLFVAHLATADALPVLVESMEDLQRIGVDPAYPLDGDYILAHDIDAADTATWDGGVGFRPIGSEETPFTGSFDGQGHIIGNLTIQRHDSHLVGLFSVIGEEGVVERLGLDRVHVSGFDQVGGFSGQNNGVIHQCYVTGVVLGRGHVGGFSGSSEGGSFSESYFGGVVQGRVRVGGFLGYGDHASVKDCFATGSANALQYLGGFVGEGRSSNHLRVFATTALSGASEQSTGGICGLSYRMTIENSFWDIETSGWDTTRGSGKGLRTGEMMNISTYRQAGWDLDTVWKAPQGNTYPQLRAFHSEESVYTLGLTDSEGSLTLSPAADSYPPGSLVWLTAVPPPGQLFAGWVGAIFGSTTVLQSNPLPLVMTQNMELEAVFLPEIIPVGTIEDLQKIGREARWPRHWRYELSQTIDATKTRTWNNGAGFAPIGTFSAGFAGEFDGKGFAIVGLTINRPNENDVGLFGVADRTSTVRNMRLYHTAIHGKDWVGALAGYSYGALTDCHVTGTVDGRNSVGGLVGKVWGGHVEIEQCWAGITVTGASRVGGLIGEMETHVNLVHSHAAGDVYGEERVGGLVGSARGCGPPKITSASGNVVGKKEVGGLVGYSHGSVTESFATGNVVGERDVGGLVGAILWSTISNSFATGNVVGDVQVGGLLGARHYASMKGDIVIVRGTYATGSVSGRALVGGLVGGGGCHIYYSYATGDVIGVEYVGGLTGRSGVETYTSYALGDVTGVSCVGGLTGYGQLDVYYCFAAGRVIAEDGGGGLAGCRHYRFQAPTSFWDTERSGTSESHGGQGLPTAAMVQKATFTAENWDFTASWDIVEGVTYPFLRFPTQSPLPVAIGACSHSADQNRDCRISFSEMLRVIALHNAGGYHCAGADEASEDGYLQGMNPEAQHCAPHDSDYEAPHWRITLSEVLRLIQFFNVDGYHDCSMLPQSGEDGFCPGRGLPSGVD